MILCDQEKKVKKEEGKKEKETMRLQRLKYWEKRKSTENGLREVEEQEIC